MIRTLNAVAFLLQQYEKTVQDPTLHAAAQKHRSSVEETIAEALEGIAKENAWREKIAALQSTNEANMASNSFAPLKIEALDSKAFRDNSPKIAETVMSAIAELPKQVTTGLVTAQPADE